MNRPKEPTLIDALIPVVSLVLMLFLSVKLFGSDSSSGPNQIVLTLGASIAAIVAIKNGHSWNDILAAIIDGIGTSMGAVLILLSVGGLIGTWLLAGTVPALIYYGLELLSPQWFYVAACIICAIAAVSTGSSWTVAGTLGVALIGVALGLGLSPAIAAGAIISGAYFGDKMSPLSDSTNICAIGAGADLYAHIRHMLYTAVPSFVLCLVLYTLASRFAPVAVDETTGGAEALLGDLEAVFVLSPLVLIPPAIVVVSIVRKVPPALAIAISSLVAVGLGVWLQGFGVDEAIRAAVGGFELEMIRATGADPGTTGADFGRLVERGGLYGMANTLIVVISAFLLAGAMSASGSLELLIDRMLAAVSSVFGLIAATMAAGATTIALTSHGGVTALVIGGLFQGAYEERELAPVNLSRSLEDSVTITEPLMPWTVSAVFMAGTLGVSTVEYAPWALFCYGGPFFSLLIAALYERTGFGIRRLKQGKAS